MIHEELSRTIIGAAMEVRVASARCDEFMRHPLHSLILPFVISVQSVVSLL